MASKLFMHALLAKRIKVIKIQCRDREWNTAFNFSSDPAFLTACMKETDGKIIGSFYLSKF